MVHIPFILSTCEICSKKQLLKESTPVCAKCEKENTKFTESNDMMPKYNNESLQNLTSIEKSLISTKVNVMKIQFSSYNNFSSGNCLLLEQDMSSVIENTTLLTLPRDPTGAGVIFFGPTFERSIWVRQLELTSALLILIEDQKHPSYVNISIYWARLNNCDCYNDKLHFLTSLHQTTNSHYPTYLPILLNQKSV